MTVDLAGFLRSGLDGGPAVGVIARPVALTLDSSQVVLRRLDGNRLRTLDDLYSAYADAWDFPSYFGWNKDAFNDCMRDLDDGRFHTATGATASGFATLITNAHELLADAEPDDFAWFAESAGLCRDHYRAELEEFGLVLGTDPEHLRGVVDRWTRAGAEPADLRSQ